MTSILERVIEWLFMGRVRRPHCHRSATSDILPSGMIEGVVTGLEEGSLEA